MVNIDDDFRPVYCNPIRLVSKTKLVTVVRGRNKVDEGLNILRTNQKIVMLHSYQRMRFELIDMHSLQEYFPKGNGRSLRYYYYLLQNINAYPMRVINFYSKDGTHKSIVKAVAYLLEVGYISVTKKPRKLMMLNKYTKDNVYWVNSKGIDVLRTIYEKIGLM